MVVAGVGAAIAGGQSWKTRASGKNEERLGQQEGAQDDATSEKNKAGGETGTDQAALNLSRDLAGHRRATPRDSVKFKLAILTALAKRPDGRASLDDLRDDVEALTAEDQSEEIASALDDIDIFQSGLVTPEGDGLRITDAGRSALRALGASNEPSFDLPAPSPSPSLKMIDHLVGTEERLKIFDLDRRDDKIDVDPDRMEETANAEDTSSASTIPAAAQESGGHLPHESIAQPIAPEVGAADLQNSNPIPVPQEEPRRPSAPAFFSRNSDAEAKTPALAPPERNKFSKLIAAGLQQAQAIWQRHLERDGSTAKAARRTGNVGGVAIALLTLLVLVMCAGAVIALTQIRSLKSEIATLQRELSPLRERAARADFLEKAKQKADQQTESQNKSVAEKKAGADPRTEQAALNLTPEEIRLIRDFIKPAPAAGTPAPAIKVGDTVGIATIPLPSQLMEKIPKLLGARFTTRNGSIIILRRDSRQADLVLPPN
ncbi:hypothetical protein JQ597_13175 [Bradyrhizobium sp. AUGA SZCCT0177]|uniref:hypothetical protein n=1 Tax=Bradyrhizobium sp. AUGA SZCCT0177 TaxID=2807665 RepID=UPI001BA835CD|nr:hypothetical protein [Bradyrhizobium sp. AUGA SZCCT0177]MBR1282993.1 hypothetical protein [Bradyrhizobium sp. AUGA SZCCT0177]